jgi:hypothetical protein
MSVFFSFLSHVNVVVVIFVSVSSFKNASTSLSKVTYNGSNINLSSTRKKFHSYNPNVIAVQDLPLITHEF